MSDRRGGLSLELMLSVMIMGICSIFVVYAYRMFLHHDVSSKEPIVLGLMQLQELVALSEILEVRENEVHLLYENNEIVLKERNESLMRSPGTVIYLHPIHDIAFWMEEELLLVSFVWQEKESRYVLGKKEWWRD